MNIIILKPYIKQEFQENQQSSTFAQPMGNHSNNKDFQSLHENWVTAAQPTSAVYSHINLYRTRLLVNTVTLDYIQEYNLYFSCEEQFKQYLHATEWRQGLEHRDPLAYIPPIRAFINTSTVELCSHSYSASIYFDKIEMKLQEINDIPFRDAMYMMRICLEGFKLLMDHFGAFRVTEDMVFINRDGQVKVWINADLSSIIPNKKDSQQLVNIRQYNSNNTVINLRQNNRQIMRQSTNQFQNASNMNSFGQITPSPPQARPTKVSKSTSLSRKNDQQLLLSRNSQNLRQNNTRLQNDRFLREINEQNMIKDILRVVEDNIDIEVLKRKMKSVGRSGCRFMMFSEFVREYMANQNLNNSFTRNNNSFSTALNKTQQHIPHFPNKPYSHSKNAYKFISILQLYNKYVQQFGIKVPRKMEVIFDIFRNRFEQRWEQYQMSQINQGTDSNITNHEGDGNDQTGVIDINASYDDKMENTQLLKSTNNKNKITKLVNSIQQINNDLIKQKQKIVPLRMSEEYRRSFENESAIKNLINNQNMNNNMNVKQKIHKNEHNLGQLIGNHGYQTNFNNIYSSINAPNKGSFEQQSAPQNSTQNLQKSSFSSLINNKAVPIAQININININNNCLTNTNNRSVSQYSHMNRRGNSVDQRSNASNKFTNVQNKTNAININSNNSISNNINNVKSPPVKLPTNSMNYQNSLSVLPQQQYHSDGNYQQHRIIRTNHIPRNSNDENITEYSGKNMKIGHYRINNIHNMNVNNKCGIQSPKVHSSTNSDNKIFHNIIYLRTPSKLQQKQQQQIPNIYNPNKPNSVNIISHPPFTHNYQYPSRTNLNKVVKVQKYISNTTNNYFSKNNINTRQSVQSNHKNDDPAKSKKNYQFDIIRNACHVQKRNNNNIPKDNRLHTYKLNGSTNSLVTTTIQPIINPTSIPSTHPYHPPLPNPQKSQYLDIKHKIQGMSTKNKYSHILKQPEHKQTMNYSYIDSYELDSEIADDLQMIFPENLG